jgi:hypothetical protein
MRPYLFIISACLFAAGCFVAEPVAAPKVAPPKMVILTPPPPPPPPAVEMSPHAEALQLVFAKEGKRIRDVELDFAKAAEPTREVGKDHWWHDVRVREWSADRPFYPGYIDSTHFFSVTYKIDGKVVASWDVDTRAGTVKSDAETPFGPVK